MKECNQKINCSVKDCCYNESGCACNKNCIMICCDHEGCTKCDSFVMREE